MEIKFEKFYELLIHVQDFIKDNKFNCSTDSVYVDLAIWNEHVTVKYNFSIYLIHAAGRLFVTDCRYLIDATPNVIGAWSIDRVRGGYQMNKIR